MPRTAAKTLSDAVLLPTLSANPTRVHVALIFRGVAFDPDALVTALDGLYPTVTSPRDADNSSGYGPYEFEISP